MKDTIKETSFYQNRLEKKNAIDTLNKAKQIDRKIIFLKQGCDKITNENKRVLSIKK